MVRPVRPRQRHRGRGLLITLVVLVVLLVAADRIGDYVAEQVAAGKLQSSQNLAHEPNVDIAGFPFLTQLASGDYGQVGVTANDVVIGDGEHRVDVSHVTVNLHDVHVSRDFSSFRAETADAAATLGYPQLSRALGIGVSYSGDGRIKASKKITVLGQTITPTITVRPRLVNDTLSFADPAVDGAAQVAAAALGVLAHYFDLTIPVSQLPFDVDVRSLRVTPDGVVLVLTGSDISYAGGS